MCESVGVGVSVIAWERMAVCGWGSLDYYRKMCVSVGVNVELWV